ncbi:helix-turn-helix domain-containing protein [Chitinophaga sp. S165]|uniref:winged helix-turn-helix transcriptional regulator n=1 Tax=Chitinophaga sp. S165 TaxID=2135462 RepID=UPI000D70FF40|nr:helix-turn-helix domain-containing protein [Chitinophaga sp. S165]PWV46149.1 HxlR family transcriptional regulator [Chitinophaga sp. S165]
MSFKSQNRIGAQECTEALTAVGDALYVIGGKWKLRIIIALSEGHTRFNELQRKVDGISARVLSNELKDLELNNFLTRTVQTGSPVIVEYKLTDYADTLQDVLKSLQAWGAMHRRTIKERMRQEALATS